MERLLNYCIFKILKFFCTLRTRTQFIPNITQSAQTLDYIIYYITLHYITLHYIILLWYFETCTVYTSCLSATVNVNCLASD